MTDPNRAGFMPPHPSRPPLRARHDTCCRTEALQSATEGAYGAERCIELFIDRLERSE